MTQRDLVVIGASAGGVRALRQLVSGFDAGFPAAICVVLHVGKHESNLPDLLSLAGPLPARHAADGEALQPSSILVAPPDHHLLIEGGHVRLTRGPKEHHTRPAVDPLFRSAALSHGNRAVGVLLTGRLDDGSAGLRAIKECGGIAVVQDPAGAEWPSMPLSAMQAVDVDHCVPLAELPARLRALAGQRIEPSTGAAPEHWRHEHAAGMSGETP